MALRVTRQFGEVLGTGGGKARVARQYIEVLGTAAIVHFESLTSSLNLVGEQGNYLGVQESFWLESKLNLTSKVVTSGLLQCIASPMSLVQTVGVWMPYHRCLVSRLHLDSVVGKPGWGKNFMVSNTLEMSHVAGRAYFGVASTALLMVQEGWWSEVVSSTINLIQDPDWGKTKGLEVSTLGLGQTLFLNADWSRPISQDVGVGHSLMYYVPSECGSKKYTPYIGENTITNNPTPPDTNLPLVQGLPVGDRFQLQYPGIGEGADTVELRAPNLDNRERLAFNRINRETRGGRLIVFADPIWPQINTLVLSFSGLTKAEVDGLQDFMRNYLGKEVGLTDWEGHQWVGIITSPTESAVQDGKGGQWSISLEFEGVMLEEMPSGSYMSISSTVVAVLV